MMIKCLSVEWKGSMLHEKGKEGNLFVSSHWYLQWYNYDVCLMTGNLALEAEGLWAPGPTLDWNVVLRDGKSQNYSIN